MFDLEPLFISLDELPAARQAAGSYPDFPVRLRETLDAIAAVRTDWKKQASALGKFSDEEIYQMLDAWITNGKLAGEGDPLLEFALLHTIRRYHRADKRQNVMGEMRLVASCPSCGARADVAYLDNKGTRYAVCQICDTSWQVPRLGCIHCGEESPDQLEYFPYEAGYRLYHCKGCDRTLPAVDLRESGRLNLPRLRAAAVEMQYLFESGAIEE